MPNTAEQFRSINGKRQIMIVDDEFVNRELLKSVLENSYDIIEAEDGQTALSVMQDMGTNLSLVLLDLMMPVMSGIDLLHEIRKRPELQQIPVIVLTADSDSEVQCLELGAIDFIPKPYPKREVIFARVRRTIELSEDRQIIQVTERDTLTGLYNREFFYRYAEQFDKHHPEMAMDALVLDVNHFHMINERYGKAYGDQVLRRIGEKVREIVRGDGGIVCRREADTFLIYCPHREDYSRILSETTEGLTGDENASNRVRLRLGIYSDVDKSIDIERRFDRAKLAGDKIRNSFTNTIALYDNDMHESELFTEQLIEDFRSAIDEEQFLVLYQPKFDVRPEIPVLASAEALVRWLHPKLGTISPGVFIPLFEENGLIQELDAYVWRKTAAQIREWKRKFDISVPVSVNVSRVDMYDPNLVANFRKILEEYELCPEEFLLEITESAYTEDSEQIINTVNELREYGFRIEMDDFGTGYSSLNMISSLPIDALKLDMKFIRNAFQNEQDTRMIEVIIDIADYLEVPVIAEGVETEEQLRALRTLGCDIVQGYYFSKPVPPEEYEKYVIEKKTLKDVGFPEVIRKVKSDHKSKDPGSLHSIAHALTSGYESIYYVDANTGHFVHFSMRSTYQDLQIEKSGSDFFGQVQELLRARVYEDDQERVSLSLGREALLTQLVSGSHFVMNYRRVVDGVPVYYNLRAVNADGQHIVVGISNIDSQIRESGSLGMMAENSFRDALTGVKNRHAYNEAEKKINEDILQGEAGEFAIVVCDINDLKTTNDEKGHKAGDSLIRSASAIICNVFKHSPVYRIGGDEFVAILRGADYESREELIRIISDKNARNAEAGLVVVACGLSEFRDGDTCASDVFERADAAMYRNKAALKGE